MLTCFHVGQVVTADPPGSQRLYVNFASNVVVEGSDGRHHAAALHHSCTTQRGMQDAIVRDYALLSAPTLNCPHLRLGSFASIDEGDEIYLAGYPFAIDQPVIARGLLSTKWQAPAHLFKGPSREVAWLDVTMNKGNSGGPVLRLAADEANDEVIGIASFGLNPFAAQMENVSQMAATFPGSAEIMGIPMREFFGSVGDALVSNSLGVGGCVAVDYARTISP